MIRAAATPAAKADCVSTGKCPVWAPGRTRRGSRREGRSQSAFPSRRSPSTRRSAIDEFDARAARTRTTFPCGHRPSAPGSTMEALLGQVDPVLGAVPSNRQTWTRVADGDHRLKLVPSPSQLAPSGNGLPGQANSGWLPAGAPRRRARDWLRSAAGSIVVDPTPRPSRRAVLSRPGVG